MRLVGNCAKPSSCMKVWWLLSLMILASALPAEAALCTLVWNANPESDVAGYRVYHSYSSNGYTMGSYSYSTQATFATCEDMEIGMDGKLHYWTVTAYDTSGNESPFPAEVWMQMPLLTESAPIPVPDLDAAPASLPPPPSPNCWWIFFRVCP